MFGGRLLNSWVLPLLVALAGAAAAWLAHKAAGQRRAGGDTGDFWTRVVARAGWTLGVVLAVSFAVEPLSLRLWRTGSHALLDLSGSAWFGPTGNYWIALTLPFAVWGAFVLYGLRERPGDRDARRWLAGAISEDGGRAWVLWCAAPPVAIALYEYQQADLARGAAGYPAAAWGTLVVLALSLAGVAWSAGTAIPRQSPAPQPAEPPPPPPSLVPWPDALAERGLQVETLRAWSADVPARPPQGGAVLLADELSAPEARSVAPELLEAVEALLRAEAGPARLVQAPDDCGQAEAVALAARLLERRFYALTLVITPEDATGLAAQLQRFLPAGRNAAAIEEGGGVPRDALVWVVDADVLSDYVLPALKDDTLTRRLGLVVWWQLHEYTGVLAANVWAVARRLHRLIGLIGREDTRTLVLMRSAPHGGAELASFVRRLLPHAFPKEAMTVVEPRFQRAVHVHRLLGHTRFFAAGHGRNIDVRLRHPALVAAKVSVEAGWPTALDPPADVTQAEVYEVGRLPAPQRLLADQLCPRAAEAGARLVSLRDGDVLALRELVSQGGRAAEAGLPHHVGLLPSENPYVSHLLAALGRQGHEGFPASRRLVGAESHPAIIARHLAAALNEHDDTHTGLLKTFLWSGEVIRETLHAISQEIQLSLDEVRFLGRDGRLRVDVAYRSKQPSTGRRHPLRTVGTRLVEVRDPTAGHGRREGVRLRVDPERLVIDAYPDRVFMAHGRRYRVRPWESVDDVCRRGWVECVAEQVYLRTWRIRRAYLYDLRLQQAPVAIGVRGKLFTRANAGVQYEETVSGAVIVEPDLAGGTPARLRVADYPSLTQALSTRALVLGWPSSVDHPALAALCQALRHVLPVHVGVEDDALEVVPLNGDDVDGMPTWGLAVVDLYPGGIGLIDAVYDDSSLLVQVLAAARDWLAVAGDDDCLRTPAALAANSGEPPLQRKAALDALREVL